MSDRPPAAFFRACRAWLDLPQTEAAKTMGLAHQTLRAIERGQEVAADKLAAVHDFYVSHGFHWAGGSGRAAVVLIDPPAP